MFVRYAAHYTITSYWRDHLSGFGIYNDFCSLRDEKVGVLSASRMHGYQVLR